MRICAHLVKYMNVCIYDLHKKFWSEESLSLEKLGVAPKITVQVRLKK